MMSLFKVRVPARTTSKSSRTSASAVLSLSENNTPIRAASTRPTQTEHENQHRVAYYIHRTVDSIWCC